MNRTAAPSRTLPRTPSRAVSRTAVLLAGTAVGIAAVAPPASADMYFSKSSGRTATVSWLEVGELPVASGVPGNAHFGEMWVEELSGGRASAFGVVFDVQCEEGVTPYNPGGGHHGAEPAPSEPCQLVSLRFIEGGSLSFSMDRKLSKASLSGTLAVGDGHGGTSAAPPVSITWTGVGDTRTTREAYSSVDEYGSYTSRYTFTGRDAVIGAGSRIGPMVFDDEAGEYSDAQLGSYRSAYRSRS